MRILSLLIFILPFLLIEANVSTIQADVTVLCNGHYVDSDVEVKIMIHDDSGKPDQMIALRRGSQTRIFVYPEHDRPIEPYIKVQHYCGSTLYTRIAPISPGMFCWVTISLEKKDDDVVTTCNFNTN